MSFFGRAWDSAADRYGANRAEQYGRIAKAKAVLGIVAIVIMLMAVVYVAGGPWG